jgi:Cupredoxin-like domain
MRRLAALLLLGALTLAGCGDGQSYTSAKDGVLKVTLDEYRILPENIQVPAGPIHIEAVNRGRLTHNLVIESVEHADGEEPTLYGRTDTLHPGERGSEQQPITLKPGKYRLTCSIGNHDDLGQYGELKVVAKGS